MRGTILSLNNEHQGLLEGADLYYRFTLDDGLAALCPQPGDQVEFEVLKAQTRSYGEAAVRNLRPLANVSDKLFLSRSAHPSDVEVLECCTAVSLISEGKCAEQCIYELEKAAPTFNANALLNIKFETIKRPLNQTFLSRYSASLARVQGAGHTAPTQSLHNVREEYARPNFASESRIRQIRLLLGWSLMILIPCMLALEARAILDQRIAYNVILVAVLLSLFYGFKLNPRAYRTYLKRHHPGRLPRS